VLLGLGSYVAIARGLNKEFVNSGHPDVRLIVQTRPMLEWEASKAVAKKIRRARTEGGPVKKTIQQEIRGAPFRSEIQETYLLKLYSQSFFIGKSFF
jgi:hypothetical protein